MSEREIKITRNPIFKNLWKARQRYVVMKGSAGSGKSVDTALYYVTKLISEKGRNLLCIRKTDLSNRNSTFAELVKAIRSLGLLEYFTITHSPLKITCNNGNEVLFGGVNDENQKEKLKSITASNGSITDVWIEEATEITQDDFEIIDDRLRGILPDGLYYQIRLTFNPVSSSHWIKLAFFDRHDDNVLTHHSTYRDNAFCDAAYYQRMQRRKELDPDGYRVYGLGEWGETSGLIFSNYKIESVSHTDSDYDFVRYGQDFGYNHANVLLKVGLKDGEVYVIKEIYEHEKTTEDIIKQTNKLYWKKDVVMYCDSAEPDRIETWARAGYRALPVHKYPGSLGAAINWLKARTIHVDPDCLGTIKELQTWRWKKDKNGLYCDEPVAIGDDAMAALRYAVSEWVRGAELKPQPPQPKPILNFSFERNIQPSVNIGCEKIEVI